MKHHITRMMAYIARRWEVWRNEIHDRYCPKCRSYEILRFKYRLPSSDERRRIGGIEATCVKCPQNKGEDFVFTEKRAAYVYFDAFRWQFCPWQTRITAPPKLPIPKNFQREAKLSPEPQAPWQHQSASLVDTGEVHA
ncbi:MAG: hypothetical protein V4526_01670 [Patescibacteria group bacterium]